MTGLLHQHKSAPVRLRRSTSLPAAGDSGSPRIARILELQHTIGNQAVQRLLTDTDSTVDAPAGDALLTPPEISSAIAFYAMQPARYTKQIIMDIQFEVGTTPTGKMTAPDVLAVAKRQKEMNDAGEKPELKIDGKAGPRTLPAIFKIGLAKDEALNTYSDEARDLFANRQGKSDEDIAVELVKLVNQRLAQLNIPTLKPDLQQQLAGRGAFQAADWTLLLDKRQFTDPKLRNMQQTNSTIYHESRHAEQHFRVAQMLAGRKRTAEQIHIETGILLDVCQEAVNRPLKPGTMEAVIAEDWHESLFGGEGLAKRQRNSQELRDAFAARQAAEKAQEENPSPQNAAKLAAARARFEKAVKEHDDTPHEFDAERLEDRVEKRTGSIN